MKKYTLFLLSCLFLLNLCSSADATLLTIGTADYDSNGSGVIDTNESYNLIWDDDDDLIWLDYIPGVMSWYDHMSLASGIESALTYNIKSSYRITWDSTDNWSLGSIEEYRDIHTEITDAAYANNFVETPTHWYWSESTDDRLIQNDYAWYYSISGDNQSSFLKR